MGMSGFFCWFGFFEKEEMMEVFGRREQRFGGRDALNISHRFLLRDEISIKLNC
jgi:hypothetical protein